LFWRYTTVISLQVMGQYAAALVTCYQILEDQMKQLRAEDRSDDATGEAAVNLHPAARRVPRI
jgi:hypothetical protein